MTRAGDVLTARAIGETTIKRLEFGVGDGQWRDPAMVGDDFKIKIDITATATAPKD